MMKFVRAKELVDMAEDIKFQIWARTKDLIPTEAPVGITVGWKDKEGAFYEYDNALEYYDKFILEDKGILREPIKVRPSGIIVNGNYRWHWNWWAGIEFVPIDFGVLINKTGLNWENRVIDAPLRSVSLPMAEWEWTHEAGLQYPETLIQEGENPKINMSISQVMEWMRRNEKVPS